MDTIDLSETTRLLEGFLGSQPSIGTGAQLWVAHGDAEASIALGEAAPSAPMREDTLHKVWCATKPILNLAAVAALERAGIELDRPIGTITSCGPGVDHLSLTAILGHQAGLAEPRLSQAMLTPPLKRHGMIEARLASRASGDGDGYSEVAAPFLLARASETAAGEPISTTCERLLANVGTTDIALGLGYQDYLAVRPRLGVYLAERAGGQPRPWLYDRTFHAVSVDSSPVLGGYTSARELGRFWQAVLHQALGTATNAQLPSRSLLTHHLWQHEPERRQDPVLGRRCAFTLGCYRAVAEHGLGTLPSPRSLGHAGLFGNSFGFADVEAAIAVAVVSNGVPDSREWLDTWRSRLIDTVYRELELA